MKSDTSFLICYWIGVIVIFFGIPGASQAVAGAMVDTGQVRCYDNTGEVACPTPGRPFYGQDAHYESQFPAYQDNGDGTVTDRHTGLMWTKGVDKRKVSLAEAGAIAPKMTLGGYSDWRVPSIKELYSLIDFRGYAGVSQDGSTGGVPANAIPFINTDYFDFAYGDTSRGERYIDAQWLSGTVYVGTTMNGSKTLFGVNFADGRIKGYGYKHPHGSRDKKFYVRYVRGRAYGRNDFIDNGDGTVTDRSTGLMWMQADSGYAMNWEAALNYAEALDYAGYDDWRLPDAKELQFIVDYTRSPDTTGSPAIAPVFETTPIVNEAGRPDYPCFWTSTTHLDGPRPGSHAVYIAFGRALGKMRGRVMDVHGAGAQRSDPKTGTPTFRGPQGDAVRIDHFVRCVRGGAVTARTLAPRQDKRQYPYSVNVSRYSSNDNTMRSTSRPGSLHGGRNFVQRLDRDGDGRVSRSEYDGPPDRFDHHDRNRDGYISSDEAPSGPPPRGARPSRPY